MSGNVLYKKSAATSSINNPAIIVTDAERINDAWEIAFSNGGAIMDEIPVFSRDTHDQIAFQDQRRMANNAVSPSYNNQPTRKRGLDVNRYATKKTIAQGMLDIALLTANASQLKYVLQLGEERHDFYHLMLALIILSIVLQAIVGILFLVIGGFNINEEPKEKVADILNDIITVLVFIITLINVVINGFGMSFVEPLNSGIK